MSTHERSASAGRQVGGLLSRLSALLVVLAALLLCAGPAATPAHGAGPSFLFVGDGSKVLRHDAATGAQIDVFIPAQSNFTPFDMAASPDGNLYVINGAQVLRYDAATGALLGTFVDLLQHGFLSATDMTFGPDGNLYVGGQQTDPVNLVPPKVARFNGLTGAFIDNFIPRLPNVQLSVMSLVFGPDSNLYIGDVNTSGVAAEVLRYDGATGALIDTFIARGSTPLGPFPSLVFGPDGDLYATSGPEVLRYDGATGAFVGSFAQGGGLTIVDDLAFGPDGNLYVICQDDDRVLRYDGTTGAFIDLFVPPRNDGSFVGNSFLLFFPEPVFNQPTPTGSTPKPARVTVTQTTSPNTLAGPGSLVTHTIVAANRGEGRAAEVTIALPFDPASVEVVDAQFSRAGAWVSALLAGSLEIRTGPLDASGDVVTGTVRMRVRPDAPQGARLGAELAYQWQNDEAPGGGTGRSNRPALAVGPAERDEPWLPLGTAPTQGQSGTTFVFSGTFFVPGEPVALWYNRPAGAPVGLDSRVVDAEGVVRLEFGSAGLAPGWYSMVARGLWSGITAVGAFEVQ